ncbi:MAG: hypothetical protein ACI855_005059 [Myxococcota bacterium]
METARVAASLESHRIESVAGLPSAWAAHRAARDTTNKQPPNRHIDLQSHNSTGQGSKTMCFSLLPGNLDIYY